MSRKAGPGSLVPPGMYAVSSGEGEKVEVQDYQLRLIYSYSDMSTVESSVGVQPARRAFRCRGHASPSSSSTSARKTTHSSGLSVS